MKGIPAAWRDSILFLTGLSLIIFEAVVRTGPERYGLLMLYAGMVGLPLVLRGDERATEPPATPPVPPPPPAPPANSGPPAPSGGVIR